MSGITFRNRKYNSAIDASFSLYNGSEIGSCDSWLVGDEVSVMFDVTKKQAEQINDAGFSGISVCTAIGHLMIHIKCKVVERRHAISWRSVGKFQDLLGTSVVLEAVNGYWEDVLLWIVIGEKPNWITEDEESDPEHGD